MCFDLDSRPPIAPIAGGALDATRLVLEAADGNRFSAYRARAAEPTGAGMLVLPDVRGLHPYYEELALRFAEHGVDALALDWFGRTAGTGPRDASFDYQQHVPQSTIEGRRADIEAAAAHLRHEAGVRALFTVGFCFGGRTSFLAATFGLGLAGVIGFYGWPVGERHGTRSPADLADQLASPVLAIFGGADQGIPAEAVEEFEGALDRAGTEHRVVTYPDAPHSFFDRKAEEFAEASAQAWDEVLGFIRARTAG